MEPTPVIEEAQAAVLADPQERKWAQLAHASALLGIMVPLLNIFGPLAVWLMKKDTLPQAAEQAREALNFNITVTLVAVVCLVLMLIAIGFFLLVVLGIAWVALTIVAIVAAGSGRPYRYPFTLRLV